MAQLIDVLSNKLTISPLETYTTKDTFVLGLTSMTFNVKASQNVLFKVLGGKNSALKPAVLIEKTIQANEIYSRTIGGVTDFVFLTIKNNSTVNKCDLTIDVLGNGTREPNSLVRQHVEVDATNNINLTKQGSLYKLDLSRGLLQNQKTVDLYGTASGMDTILNTLWDDTTKAVYDDLATAVPCQIRSDNVNDTLGGSGGVCVKVTGLIDDFSEGVETVQLNGLTPVALATNFMRINKAVVTSAGTGLLNKGNIEINPIFNTSLILERITALRGKSNTFHYTVPLNEEVIISSVEMNSCLQDPAIFDLSVTDCFEPGTVGGGTPVLKKTLKFGGITNGGIKIDVDEKFTVGQTIKLDLSSNPAHGAPLGINTVYAISDGVRINTIL